MPDHAKIDRRIKRLVAFEAEHRTAVKRAEDDMRLDPEHKERYRRIIKKSKRKVEKLLPKIRRLRELRASSR